MRRLAPSRRSSATCSAPAWSRPSPADPRPCGATVAVLLGTSVLLSASVLLAACGTATTGARREGPAPTAPERRTAATPDPAPAIAADPDALAAMIRRDTSISRDVREDLTRCAGDRYPLDTDAGSLTSGDGPDLLVNVSTCDEGLGVAAYVYRMIGGKYKNVFADEQPPVYGSIEDGRLQIIHEVYKNDDPVPFPTGQESVTYVWRGDRFLQVARAFSDFGAKTPSASPEPTSTRPAPMPSSHPLDPGLPASPASPTAPASPASPAPRATAEPAGGR